MADLPDEADLEQLGLYDPSAPDAADRMRLLRSVFRLGATTDEAVRADRIGGLGSLALDLAIRPPGESYQLREFADASGADAGLVRRLWLALGLPEAGPAPLPVTPDAAEGLRLFGRAAGLLGEEAGLGLARVVGASTARMAEALTEAVRVGIETPQRGAGTPYSEVVDGLTEFTRQLLPPFLEAVASVFRRHLALISYQLWSTDEDRRAVTLERIVGFADLVGSTELLQQGSVSELAEMVERFEALAWDLVTRAGGRVVKLIGDEAMFVLEDAPVACRVAFELAERSHHPVRVGLARGEVVGLYGDYYGTTVNLAARLVRAADPSTVVVSQSVRDQVQSGFTFELLGLPRLKGFPEGLPAYRVDRR